MWMLVILLIWFHSAVASICNVNATGISPNNTIKFYNAMYMASSGSMSEIDMCYTETLKIVLHWHAACQCKQVNRTSGALEQRVLWTVLLIGCSPDTPTNPTSRKFGFSILTVHLEILHKGRLQCAFQNFKQIEKWRKKCGEILRSDCGISVLVKWVSGSMVALVSGLWYQTQYDGIIFFGTPIENVSGGSPDLG